ncbi:hypothetical protein B4U37_03260 [Sutcliffiella horikoshii]|uniref:Uncharacterized protein n=1 Tax=Sutcliffiella horikoshii TaxID=79883 RepID=A0ABN4ZC19_9BACI|nr:hypothetical protein [Sutcliffiella horikoshii]ART75122.1 hypothetical protein B4U37_03260 [Sutcliffiella horikoshii]
MTMLTIAICLILGVFMFMLVASYAFMKNGAGEESMNYKILACLVLPVLNITFGVSLNFLNSFVGEPATLTNLLVTCVHLAVWIICFVLAFQVESKGVVKVYAIFWALTLAIAGLTAYIISVETTVDFAWAMPLAMLLLPQWYGFDYFVDGDFVFLVIIMVISLVMVSASVWRWRRLVK